MFRATITMAAVVFVSGCGLLESKQDRIADSLAAPRFAYPGKPIGVPPPPGAQLYTKAYDSAKDAATQVVVEKEIAYDRIKQIDDIWNKYALDLRESISFRHEIINIISLGLSSYGTVIAAATTKTITSAADTGLKGVNTELDTDELESKATDALVFQMETDRSSAADTVYKGLILNDNNQNTSGYPLEELEKDLIKYNAAGTAGAALVSLSTSQSNIAASAQTATNGLREQAMGTATPAATAAAAAAAAEAPAAPAAAAPAAAPPPPTVTPQVAPPSN